MSKKRRTERKSGAPTVFKVIALLLILCILGALIAFLYIYTNGFNEDLKTFYLEYRDEKILTARSSRSFRTGEDHTFGIRYTFDLSGEEKGYSVKIYSRDLGENVFDYKINGKTKRYVGGTDLTAGFDIALGGNSFTLSLPKAMTLSDVLTKANPGVTIECPSPSALKDNILFTMVVENYNGTKELEIDFGLVTFCLSENHVFF